VSNLAQLIAAKQFRLVSCDSLEENMDTTTLLIIIVIVLLVGGGGLYGRGRWF
jgi:hypothetical protein